MAYTLAKAIAFVTDKNRETTTCTTRDANKIKRVNEKVGVYIGLHSSNM